jgi:endonuclease YncB( thermonuclease family)
MPLVELDSLGCSHMLKRATALVALVVLSLACTSPDEPANPDSDSARQPVTVEDAATPPAGDPPSRATARVARVIDGDTIELDDGRRVRYIGIDTPETGDPSQSIGCYGKEASDRNKFLVEARPFPLRRTCQRQTALAGCCATCTWATR